MTWRRGEVWLESEMLWFREAVAAPAFAGIGPAAIPSLAPPPGLVASRVRRAAWERRRHLRRARTTAVALSPAVVLALAALRSGSGPGAAVLMDDPPSLTFRVGTGVPVAEDTTIGPPPGRVTAVSRRRETAARKETAPTIAWHRAVSTGLPWAGRLSEGKEERARSLALFEALAREHANEPRFQAEFRAAQLYDFRGANCFPPATTLADRIGERRHRRRIFRACGQWATLWRSFPFF